MLNLFVTAAIIGSTATACGEPPVFSASETNAAPDGRATLTLTPEEIEALMGTPTPWPSPTEKATGSYHGTPIPTGTAIPNYPTPEISMTVESTVVVTPEITVTQEISGSLELEREAEIVKQAELFLKGEGVYTDEALHEWMQQWDGERDLGLLADFEALTISQVALLGYIESDSNIYLFVGSKDSQGKRVVFPVTMYLDHMKEIGEAQYLEYTWTQSNVLPQNHDENNTAKITSAEQLMDILDSRIGKVMSIVSITDMYNTLTPEQIEQDKIRLGDLFQLFHDRVELHRQINQQLSEFLYDRRNLASNASSDYVGELYRDSKKIKFDSLEQGIDLELIPSVNSFDIRIK